LTHACISFFARTDVGAVGATDRLVQSVRWVEPGCKGDRLGLPLTIGSSGLPLYLPYIYICSEDIGSPVLSIGYRKPKLATSRTSTSWPSAHLSHGSIHCIVLFVFICMHEKLESVSINCYMHENKKVSDLNVLFYP
jgi:hypothetical protein